jgi:transcriptional regulator with XRE-family HTH domain
MNISLSILRILSMDTATRIKQRMTLMGLKNVDIITSTGVSSGGVSQWVTGVSKPSGERLLALAKTLKCSPDWILSGRGSAEDLPTASMGIPVLNSEQAIRYLSERALPEQYKTTNELINGSSHVAIGLIEPSKQFEPAISQGSIYYLMPLYKAALSKLKGLIAFNVNGHVIVGRLKPMAMDKYSLLLPDSTTIRLENANSQIVGLVTHIIAP